MSIGVGTGKVGTACTTGKERFTVDWLSVQAIRNEKDENGGAFYAPP